jgi:uncharacterized delta-60 repeat protein
MALPLTRWLWNRNGVKSRLGGSLTKASASESLRLFLEPLEERWLLSGAGDPDPSFGTAGQVTTPLGSGSAQVANVLIQPGDKILVVGSVATSATASPSNLAMARYNADGSPDNGCGTRGLLVTPNAGPAAAATLQADGKILVVGGNFVLARFNAADGSLDSSFGNGGTVTTQFVGMYNVQPTSVAVQADGKIVVAGVSERFLPTPIVRQGVLARYNPDGSLDSTFGSGGEVTSVGVGDSLVLQPDGKIVVGGQTEVWTMTFGVSYAAYVQRYTADGQPDLAFGSGNRAAFEFGGATGWDIVTHLALQTDGKIVAAGRTANGDAMMRLNPDGSLDSAFGLGGKVLAQPSVQGLAIQPDGKILVAGVPDGAFEVTRWDADGSCDTRFGVAAIATGSFPPPSSARDVTLQVDGAIVVAGTSDGGFAVARYLGGSSAALTGTPNEQLVTQLYLDLLGRPVDASGLTFWSGLLDRSTASRAQVVQAIENSPEYRTDVIERLYEHLFGRTVDASGLSTWSDFLVRGATAQEL